MTGDELGRTMRAIGWTRSELSRRLGCAPTTIHRWRAGTWPIPPSIAVWLIALRAAHEAMPALTDWRKPPKFRAYFGQAPSVRRLNG